MPTTSSSRTWYIPIGLLLLTAAGLVAYDLLRLTEAEKLWGYRPLLLYTFAWSGLVCLIAGSRLQRGRSFSWRRTGLATLSGLILSLAFPGFLPFPWLLFMAFIPLLLVHDDLEKARAAGQKVRLFPYAYHTFFIWNAIATFWVTNTALAAGLFAVLVNALLMCIPLLLFQFTKRLLPRFGYVALIAYWITFEYLHMNWDLSWPWLTLGNAFAQLYQTVQWYEFTGVFGGSLWILVMNVLLFRIWQQRKEGTMIAPRQWATVATLAIVPVLLSLLIYATYQPASEQRQVLVVQTNFEPHYEKFDRASESQQIREIIGMIGQGIQDNTSYVVLPETAFGRALQEQLNDYPAVVELREALAGHPGLELISGVSAYHILREGEPHTRATRRVVGDEGIFFWESYNAAAQFTIGTEDVQFYKKSKLVPGAESFPFPWLFFFMKPVVEQLGGTIGGFGMQAKRTPFTGQHGRIAPVICYESIYGEYFAGYVRQGAQAAFIMTNDGWWDNTQGHRQHLYFASLRSIETRRSIARAANMGNSAFINERGDRLAEVPYGTGAALSGQISLNDDITFYVRWGDMIARIGLFLSLLLLGGSIVQRLKMRSADQ